MSPLQFEKELVHLSTQNRPKVIVYAEGNPKVGKASSLADFNPETEPQVHVCPIVTSMCNRSTYFRDGQVQICEVKMYGVK